LQTAQHKHKTAALLVKKRISKRTNYNTVQWLPVSLSGQKNIFGCDFLTVKVGPAVIEVRQGFNEKLLLDVVKVLSTLC
jgi:hypothetical protein